MTGLILRLAFLLPILVTPALAATAGPDSDLRGVSIGLAAAELPAEGFAGFTCAAPPAAALQGWQDWGSCPADATGNHAMHFHYATGDTGVAGHPVVLTALFNGAGTLVTLRIETEPGGRLYLRKKAFLLGLQARHRYGDEGWTCTNSAPAAGEEPVGGVFVKEICQKSTPGRSIVVSRALFRHAGSAANDFIGESQIIITSTP